MKKIQGAFAGRERMLKCGLHCHTTRSDGSGDPAEVMRIYAEKGFDYLAITDHRRYNYENYAPETGLKIIPGMEMDRNITSDAGMCFHTVSIGPSRENGNGFEHDQRFERGQVVGQREYQEVLDFLHANGNLTIYCHPEWSCTPARSFEELQGDFAMEIWNTGCALETDCDKNAAGWDELLVRGRKIYGVATDDGHPTYQHGLGWVMVRAADDLDSVLAALKRGDFYSSTGPEIYDFHLDGENVHLECSPCSYIHFVCGTRPMSSVRNSSGLISSADVKLPAGAKYIRATVVDAEGRRAWTNPIFLDARND